MICSCLAQTLQFEWREGKGHTAAFPSQKLLNHHPDTAAMMQNGTEKLIAALQVVLIYSLMYGWPCLRPHGVE